MRKGGLLQGSRFYRREEHLRRSFLASRGMLDAPAIRAAAACTEGEADLVAAARRLACLEVLEAYERGRLTFHVLWRACAYPGDPVSQRAVAAVAR